MVLTENSKTLRKNRFRSSCQVIEKENRMTGVSTSGTPRSDNMVEEKRSADGTKRTAY